MYQQQDSVIKTFNDWIAFLPCKALTVNLSKDQNELAASLLTIRTKGS